MVKNHILSEMTDKYIPDSGFETIGAYGTFLTKKYRTQDSASGTFRILCPKLYKNNNNVNQQNCPVIKENSG